MKFPTLSRIMSLVLCLCALLLILTGVLSWQSWQEESEELTSRRDRLSARLEDYRECAEKSREGETYAKASASYDKDKELYDEKAAQHRTDLAVYTATKGGIEQGKEALSQVFGPMVEAQGTLAGYEAQYNQLVAGIAAQGFSADESGLSQVNALIAQYSALAADEGTINATAAAQVDGQIAQAQAGYDQAEAAVSAAQSAYDQAVASGTATQEELDALAAALSQAQGARDTAKENLAYLQSSRDTLISTAAAQIRAGYESAVSGYNTLAGYISSAIQLRDGISQGQRSLQLGFETLGLGNWEIDKATAKLPEMLETLQKEKKELDKENSRLKVLEEEVSQLRTEEEQYQSAKLSLLANDHVKALTDGGTDLVQAVETELIRMDEELAQTDTFEKLLAGLLLSAAFFGILSVPCAFEKIPSLALLVISALLFTLCAAAAEAVSFYLLEDGHQYPAMVSAIFGLIGLLIMIPTDRGGYPHTLESSGTAEEQPSRSEEDQPSMDEPDDEF